MRSGSRQRTVRQNSKRFCTIFEIDLSMTMRSGDILPLRLESTF